MSKRLIVTLLASLGLGSSASAASLLGTTTPFSKTALCKRVGCTVSGNAQVGGYLFATYTVKDAYRAGQSGYFAFLKNGKTVAVGVYGLGSQDYSTAGLVQDLKDLVGLTGRPMPSLNGVLNAASLPFAKGSPADPLVLRRDRNVTLPLGEGMVLTNKSQRVALGNDDSKFSSHASLRFIDVAYVALAGEVEPISRLINRWAPAEERAARQNLLKALGLRSACPATLTSGKVVKISEVVGYPTSPWQDWAVARGYTLNSGQLSVGFALPGLALSTVQINSSGGDTMQEVGNSPACIE